MGRKFLVSTRDTISLRYPLSVINKNSTEEPPPSILHPPQSTHLLCDPVTTCANRFVLRMSLSFLLYKYTYAYVCVRVYMYVYIHM